MADFPDQGNFLAQAKDHTNPLPNTPFYHALIAHSAIHGGVVWFLTGSLALGIAEFFLHGIVDFLKCQKVFTFSEDQYLHIGLKLLYAFVV